MVAHLIQHPGTVSARVMARVLGISEERMKQAARLEWVPCKWTKGRRAKFVPEEVIEDLCRCPWLVKHLRPSVGFTDMADAATWALDALVVGLRGIAGPPSSVALALYVWVRQSDENRKALIPFLIRCGCGQLTRISTPSGDRLCWAPVRDSFAYVLTTLERDGLPVPSAVSQ